MKKVGKDCPVCGEKDVPLNDFCPKCHWFRESFDEETNEAGGANIYSLSAYKEEYEEKWNGLQLPASLVALGDCGLKSAEDLKRIFGTEEPSQKDFREWKEGRKNSKE